VKIYFRLVISFEVHYPAYKLEDFFQVNSQRASDVIDFSSFVVQKNILSVEFGWQVFRGLELVSG
jgi:hypothetical protein